MGPSSPDPASLPGEEGGLLQGCEAAGGVGGCCVGAPGSTVGMAPDILTPLVVHMQSGLHLAQSRGSNLRKATTFRCAPAC